MKTQIKSIAKLSVFVYTLLLYACQDKITDVVPSKGATVNFLVLGYEYEDEIDKLAAAKMSLPQDPIVIDNNDGFALSALLTVDSTSSSLPSYKRQLINKKNLQATATYDLESFSDMYIYIYEKETGNLVDYRRFWVGYGFVENRNPIELAGGRNYTIIAYGYPANETLVHYYVPPEMTNASHITTAEIRDIDYRMVFFKENIYIAPDENKIIPITFKNIFAGLHLKLKLPADAASYYNLNKTILYGAVFPKRVNANYKVSTGVVTYNPSLDLVGSPINWTEKTVAGNTVTSGLTYIINPAISGSVNLNELSIGPLTKVNTLINNVLLKPGIKYDLTLNVTGIPKLKEVLSKLYPVYVDIDIPHTEPPTVKAERTYTISSSNYGLIFDIYYLDNAFNLEINGTPITNREIEFQGDDAPFSVAFPNGDTYDEIKAELIYYLNYDERIKKPIIRLLVKNDGTKELYGRRFLDTPLEKLTLINGTTWNSTVWNTSGNNTVKLSSVRTTHTAIYGRLAGLNAE